MIGQDAAAIPGGEDDGAEEDGGPTLVIWQTPATAPAADAEGPSRLDECLRRAQEKAADDRERRQVAKLTQAAQYWKTAAAYWRLDRQASEATRTGDKTATATLTAQALRKADEAMQCFNRLPAGWARGRYTDQRQFP